MATGESRAMSELEEDKVCLNCMHGLYDELEDLVLCLGMDEKNPNDSCSNWEDGR